MAYTWTKPLLPDYLHSNNNINTTDSAYKGVVLRVPADIFEVAHNKRHKVGAHFHTRFVVIPQQTVTVWRRSLQWHVEEGDVLGFTDDRQAKVGFQVWLIEAREGRSGICRLKVGGGYVPGGRGNKVRGNTSRQGSSRSGNETAGVARWSKAMGVCVHELKSSMLVVRLRIEKNC